MKKIELLAPVGSMESLYAAINNGADAVYLGGKLFNARHYASNFSDEDLREAIEYAHNRNVKVYITLNISIKNSELEELRRYLKFLDEIGPDALIVQDLGVINIIKSEFPNLILHGSTQMTINNSYGVNFLKELGFERIVLARELSIDEIEKIKRETDAEIEVFVHGALCVSYSGQCLMSSIIGGRSGNRGRCAQTCRMPFTLRDENSQEDIVLDGKYILSTKDLNSIENIGKLIDIGVDSFKIEGRMKKPEYVALIVNKYRKAIDGHLYKKEEIDDDDLEDIRKIFNRGFTKGFLGKESGRDYISLDKPNNRGTYIGRAIEFRNNRTKIKLKYELNKGDGLNADNIDGSEDFFNVDKIFINGKERDNALKGQYVEIMTYRPIKKNAKLYKTYDKELYSRIREEYMGEKDIDRKPISFEAELKIDKKPVFKARCNDLEVIATGEDLVERARKSGLSRDRIIEQLSKLNDTVFKFSGFTGDIDKNIFLPISTINSIRRELVEKMNIALEKREKEDRRISFSDYENIEIDYEYKKTILSIYIDKFEILKRLDFSKLDRLYLRYGEYLNDAFEYLKSIDNKDFEIFISLPRIIGDGEFLKIEESITKFKEYIDGIMIGNTGSLKFLKDRFPDINIRTDYSLNIYNTEAIQFLYNNGIIGNTLSTELNLNEIEDISNTIESDMEVIGYGYLKLMTMKNSPISLIEDCKISSSDSKYELVDRKDMKFPLLRQGNITTVLNSKILFIPEYIDSLKEKKISSIRLEFYREDELIEDIQDLYYQIIKKGMDRNRIENFVIDKKLKDSITKGHYNRGVE